MRCKTCNRFVKPRSKRHNLIKQQCAKCHYLGQIAAFPGGRKQTFCKRGHLLKDKIWNNRLRRDCVKCQIELKKQRMEILA